MVPGGICDRRLKMRGRSRGILVNRAKGVSRSVPIRSPRIAVWLIWRIAGPLPRGPGPVRNLLSHDMQRDQTVSFSVSRVVPVTILLRQRPSQRPVHRFELDRGRIEFQRDAARKAAGVDSLFERGGQPLLVK